MNYPETPPPWLRHARQLRPETFGIKRTGEFAVALFLLAVLILLKLLNTGLYIFDSDESQHLHVIWGWARGFVQYRDICDNHMPLFQIGLAPVFGLIGDRATALHWMRYILLPLYVVVMWCTYRIGTILFSKRVAIWAVIASGLYPGYHFCSLEFRTDNVWATLWLLAILTLMKEGITTRSALVAGLLIGLCFGISMKTALLLASLFVGLLFSVLFVGRQRLGLRWFYLSRWSALFLITAALVPAIIILTFAYQGVWPQFRYWVFENNIVPGLRNIAPWWILAFPLGFPLVVYAARFIVRATADPVTAFRRSLIFVTCGFYISALRTFWPLVTRQDYVPFQPLAFIFYCAALLPLSDFLAERLKKLGVVLRPAPLPAFLTAGQLLVIMTVHPPWQDGERQERDLLRITLAVTDPGDFVLDEKGETIFRQRCFCPIWEPLLRERIVRGLMKDDGPARCVATRTCLVHIDEDITDPTEQYMRTYYLPIGAEIRVAGVYLEASKQDAARLEFETAIPTDYTLVSADERPIAGQLDGAPYTGGRRALAPGRHVFQPGPETRGSRLAAVWSQAVERGFKPIFLPNDIPVVAGVGDPGSTKAEQFISWAGVTDPGYSKTRRKISGASESQSIPAR